VGSPTRSPPTGRASPAPGRPFEGVWRGPAARPRRPTPPAGAAGVASGGAGPGPRLRRGREGSAGRRPPV